MEEKISTAHVESLAASGLDLRDAGLLESIDSDLLPSLRREITNASALTLRPTTTLAVACSSVISSGSVTARHLSSSNSKPRPIRRWRGGACRRQRGVSPMPFSKCRLVASQSFFAACSLGRFARGSSKRKLRAA
jgi:hypothetical protein